jgi:hypothetical protein
MTCRDELYDVVRSRRFQRGGPQVGQWIGAIGTLCILVAFPVFDRSQSLSEAFFKPWVGLFAGMAGGILGAVVFFLYCWYRRRNP